MRTLLILLGVIMVVSMIGGIGMVMLTIAAKARRQKEADEREAEELIKRMDDHVAQRERAAVDTLTTPPMSAERMLETAETLPSPGTARQTPGKREIETAETLPLPQPTKPPAPK